MAIVGLNNLFKRMDRMASKETIAKGLKKSCLRVERDAKINCPVDNGLLRASITNKVNVDELKGEVGTPLEYAPYLVFMQKVE